MLNTNENATIPILQKNLEVKKAQIDTFPLFIGNCWVHAVRAGLHGRDGHGQRGRRVAVGMLLVVEHYGGGRGTGTDGDAGARDAPSLPDGRRRQPAPAAAARSPSSSCSRRGHPRRQQQQQVPAVLGCRAHNCQCHFHWDPAATPAAAAARAVQLLQQRHARHRQPRCISSIPGAQPQLLVLPLPCRDHVRGCHCSLFTPQKQGTMCLL